MPIKETNEVRMFGVLPSQGADPIPVRLATEAEGAGMKETNEVRMVGVLPSQGADPILVSGMLYPSPISISPPAFVPRLDNQDWSINYHVLLNRASLLLQRFYAPVIVPHGVTITKITLYGYRDDAIASMVMSLQRIHRLGGAVEMGLVTADWITGWNSGFDDSIGSAVINNGIYSYALTLAINPNNDVLDVRFSGAKIEFET